MLVDHSSLMLAIAFSGAALSITLFASWLSSRTESFLLTWAAGTLFVVVSAASFSYYQQKPGPWWALLSMSCLSIGLSIVYGAAIQFRRRVMAATQIGISILATLLPMGIFFPWGYAGLGFISANLGAMVVLFLTSVELWQARRESPVQIVSLVILYAVTGVSFGLCAIPIAMNSPLHMEGPPQNWAENINAVVSIISVTGIGAISLSLHQSRIALRHQSDALTDALTGLMNRRALFNKHGNLPSGAGVVLFDLDFFKSINDMYGHDTGDRVLRRFSEVLSDHLRPADTAARLGGEEFALVMPRGSRELTMMMAETIRTTFEAEELDTDIGAFSCTVSAGVAYVRGEPETLDAVLNRADGALYEAKRQGRNRVRMAKADQSTSSGVLHLPRRA
ncbi:GGDEF domain-containing protein [Flaviflagellibacter deserti]|uniref:diguanylate cyclase n=1 Tax=Flaviflagellibacter deserti TaxID=2267266 RepID=A0ABV9YXG7_9HYPH